MGEGADMLFDSWLDHMFADGLDDRTDDERREDAACYVAEMKENTEHALARLQRKLRSGTAFARLAQPK